MRPGVPTTAFGPTLETPRLLLRPPSVEDFEPWAALMADAEHVRYIGGAQPRAVAWRGLMAMIGCWAANGFAMFSVIEKSTGRWIGRVGPWSPEGWPGTEVGWTLARDAAGQGYAREAAETSIDWAFDTLGWADVIHTIDPDNAPSIALARRLGSRHLRSGLVLPEPFHETLVEVWGQTRDEWRAQRSAAA
jgi:RimJ/RimL family protein N-acetyltransferase